MTAVTVDSKDGITIVNQATGTYGPFSLLGGVYSWTNHGATAAQLFAEAPDQSTFIAVAAALNADGCQLGLYLPAGVYEFQITATNAWIALSHVPMNRT